jgi:hypothetical protein
MRTAIEQETLAALVEGGTAQGIHLLQEVRPSVPGGRALPRVPVSHWRVGTDAKLTNLPRLY